MEKQEKRMGSLMKVSPVKVQSDQRSSHESHQFNPDQEQKMPSIMPQGDANMTRNFNSMISDDFQVKVFKEQKLFKYIDPKTEKFSNELRVETEK